VDNILDALKEAFPKALSRTDINNLFSRHKSSADIARALKWLKEEDKVYSEYRETLGRKEEVWYLKVAK
jgi:predicted transcriptional regulator